MLNIMGDLERPKTTARKQQNRLGRRFKPCPSYRCRWPNFSNFHMFGDQISGRCFVLVPRIATNSSDKSLNPDLPKVFGEEKPWCQDPVVHQYQDFMLHVTIVGELLPLLTVFFALVAKK